AQGSAVEQQQVDGVVQDGASRTSSNGTAGATDEEILASIPALGATLDDHGGCVFRVWAPHPQRATLVVKRVSPARAGAGGSDAEGAAAEGERVEMGRDGNVWFARLQSQHPHGIKFLPSAVIPPLVLQGDNYHFVFEWEGKTLERRDARARATDYESNDCIVVDPRFSWTPFEPPPFEALNIYQLHVGAFTGRLPGGGTFAALKEKLPYIKNLGFNAVQVGMGRMPTLDGVFWMVDAGIWMGDGGGWMVDGGGWIVAGGLWANTFSTFVNPDTPLRPVVPSSRPSLPPPSLPPPSPAHPHGSAGDGLRFDCVHAMPWKVSQSLTWHLHREFPHRILISGQTRCCRTHSSPALLTCTPHLHTSPALLTCTPHLHSPPLSTRT
ncbi:unnamed protein product, partial [Closterium sp. NIES-54]